MEMWVLILLLSSTTGLSGDDGWTVVVQAEVRAREGYPVVLPCSFSHPLHSHHASLQVSWRRGHGADSALVFHCVSQGPTESCEEDLHQDQRYRLEGNPREHDLSLRINSAALQDSGRYYCHMMIQGKEHSDKMGTRLRVEAPPRILEVALESGPDGAFSAMCRAKGCPPPDVQWLDSEGRGSEGAWQRGSEGAWPLTGVSHFQTSSTLQDVQPQTHYVCSASNPLGQDQATLYFLRPLPLCAAVRGSGPLALVLSVALGSKVALLLGLGLWMWRTGALQRPLWCGGQ